MTNAAGRWLAMGSLLLAVVLVVLGPPVPAFADPAGPDSGNASLQSQLEVAVRGYNDAKGPLDVAQQHLDQLNVQATATEAELADLTVQVNAVAVAAYKGGQISALSTLLDSGSPGDFLDRATVLQAQAQRDDAALRRLHSAQAQYAQQRTDIDADVQQQADQLAAMAKRKKDAENALAAAGGAARTACTPCRRFVKRASPTTRRATAPAPGGRSIR